MELKAALLEVQERVERAAGGRPVVLIAVSKTQPIQKIVELYEMGQRDFGENYVQELLQKASALKLSCPDIRWHFIGHLQSNKVKMLLPVVFAIHSVDSISLAKEVSKRWRQSGRDGKLPIFLEVNIDEEATKSGFSPTEARVAASEIEKLEGLQLEGLMCIPSSEAAESSAAFGRLRDLEKQIKPLSRGCLSMGMSSDFEMALQHGATHIRVGTRLFGRRTP